MCISTAASVWAQQLWAASCQAIPAAAATTAAAAAAAAAVTAAAAAATAKAQACTHLSYT